MHRDQLPISEPCHADWSRMEGNAARRFCGSCNKHVHDLSAMTAPEARRLLATEPGPCVRYTVGAGGEVVHRPGRLPRLLAMGAALLGAAPAFASGMAARPETAPVEPGWMERVVRGVQEALGVSPEIVISEVPVIMGEVAPVEPPAPPPPPPVEIPMGRIAAPPLVVPLPKPGETVIPEVEAALRR